MRRNPIIFVIIFLFITNRFCSAMILENECYRVEIAENWIGTHPPGSLIEFSSTTEPMGNILDGMDFAGMVYADGYTDGFPAAIDSQGYVTVPQGPGLGVTYDWTYIDAHSTGKIEVTSD